MLTTEAETGNISNVIPAEAGNAYLYDKVGNRTSMMVTDSGGTKIHMYTYDNSGNMVHDATYAYGYDPENRLVKVRQSGPYGTLTLGEALDSPLTYTTGGSGNWTAEWGEGHDDINAAYAPSLAQGQESWMQTQVEGPGTFSFWDETGDSHCFFVDAGRIATVDWPYAKNSQSHRGWVCPSYHAARE